MAVREGRSFHHSTNDLLNDGYWHKPFDVFCSYDHGGDCKAAVKAAAAQMGMAASPSPSSHTDPFGSSGSTPSGPVSTIWPDPKPLPQVLPPVQSFSMSLLPSTIRAWVRDIADRIQCPADFPAIAAVVALATLVGRKVGIRPKKYDVWTCVANLWGAVVGRPGILKTPALQEPLKPLKRLEIEAARRHAEELKEYEAEQVVSKESAKVAAGAIREKLKKGNGDASAVAEARAMAAVAGAEGAPAPVRRRYIVNDATVEKLGELLNQNPNGLLCYRDELTGLFRTLDKDGQEAARAFYLEAWNGDGRFTFDRIGRGTLDIEAACISMLGGIQPGPLSDYQRGAVSAGKGDDGFLQRFQLAVWPDVSREWVNVDRWPDSSAKGVAYDVFTRLDALRPADVGAARDEGDDEIPYLRFAPDAQAVFDEWRAELEQRVRSGNEHPAIESHLAKYRSLIPSLALLLHLAQGDTGPVAIDALDRAIAWGAYLETHARRIFADALNPATAAAHALYRKLAEGELQDGFGRKDVYRPGWSRLKTSEDAEQAVNLLVDHGWLRETVDAETGGAPRTRYWMHPRLLAMRPPKNADTPQRATALTAISTPATPYGSNGSAPLGGSGDFSGPESHAHAATVEVEL